MTRAAPRGYDRGPMAARDPRNPAPDGPAIRARSPRRLVAVVALTAGFMVVEALGGWLTGSLALLSDAGHMLADVAALSLALLAHRFARRPASPRNTYGFYRAEILAAFLNGVALVAATAWILVEAYARFRQPTPVAAGPMLVVAAAGLAVNLAAAAILSGGRANLNVRGALLHVIADAFGSVGALAAGVAILLTGRTEADAIASAVIACLIFAAALGLVRASAHILLEGAPPHLDAELVAQELLAHPGVLAVHDLHIWTLTSGFDALSGHLVVEPQLFGSQQMLLPAIERRLRERFGIEHTTLQVERAGAGKDEPVTPWPPLPERRGG